MQVTCINPDDVLVWPDGSWCYRHELSTMSHKSDDFTTYPANTAEWATFLSNEERTA